MNKISVFGSTGFIGSRFSELYEINTIKVNRDEYISPTNNILYLISTVDNYNVYHDLHVDIDTNLTVLMNVLEKIDKSDKDLVFNFVSSWFVYGQSEQIPYNEEKTQCNPIGFYSITKRCAEQMVISFCKTFNIKYRIFRLANVLGEGDEKISKKKNALQFLIREIVNDNEIELYYGGRFLRDYIYIDDVCRAIYFCMNNAPYNQIINIGSGIPYNFLEIINLAIKLSNSKSKIIEINPTKFHKDVQVKDSYLDISKLLKYGYENKFDISFIIKKLVEFYSEKYKKQEKQNEFYENFIND